jgi:hypothetical protein
MTFTLDLLPANPNLEFIDEGHKYVYHDPVLGSFEPKSVSTVLAETEAKCFNYGIWRKSLMKKGLTFDQAEAFMKWHREHRAQVGTDFHALAERRFKEGDHFDLALHSTKVLPEAVAIFEHFNENFVPRVRRVLVIELPMIHKSLLMTGTPDWVGELDDGLLLGLDYKAVGQDGENSYRSFLWWLEYHGLTPALHFNLNNPPDIHGKNSRSWRKRSEWVLQLAAYGELVRSNYGIAIENAANMVLSDQKFRLLTYNSADLAQAWSRFAGFLLEYHSREASLGNRVSQLALPSVAALFT